MATGGGKIKTTFVPDPIMETVLDTIDVELQTAIDSDTLALNGQTFTSSPNIITSPTPSNSCSQPSMGAKKSLNQLPCNIVVPVHTESSPNSSSQMIVLHSEPNLDATHSLISTDDTINEPENIYNDNQDNDDRIIDNLDAEEVN